MKRPVSVLLFLQVLATCFAKHEKPQQVHIAFGSTVDTIVVTWSTMTDMEDNPPMVTYGIKSLDKIESGQTIKFVDGGKNKRAQFIHKVILPNLQRSSEYMYKCGNEKTSWSEVFHFRVPPPDDVWKPKLSIYGDMGLSNNHALPRIIKETMEKKYDAIFHIGDFAYNMKSKNGRVGDQFMRNIEPVAANTPYMTCVGNHEAAYNFSHYKYRFNMPGEKDLSTLVYSINMGPAHFISLSTEVYFFLNCHMQARNQRNWLRKDLIKANLPKNRAKQPWIIVMGHRPLYCSNRKPDNEECNYMPNPYRNDLEEMFYTYGVDIVIGAHKHSYERMWPMYKYTVHNGTESPYQDPNAPVLFVSGSAGCREDTYPFVSPSPNWSAFRSSDYGTTSMDVHNQTHINIQQISDSQNGTVIDDFWVIKHSHEFYLGSNMSMNKLREHCNKELDYLEKEELCNDNTFLNVQSM